jgi:hypothetical protein
VAVERPHARDYAHATEFLRAVATPCLEGVSRRLRLARHGASFEDHLADASHLIRFELRPWQGPLENHAGRTAMLEIGLSPEHDEQVTAWYWLDREGEAPQMTTEIHATKLDSSWIETVILDFVRRVLRRG